MGLVSVRFSELVLGVWVRVELVPTPLSPTRQPISLGLFYSFLYLDRVFRLQDLRSGSITELQVSSLKN